MQGQAMREKESFNIAAAVYAFVSFLLLLFPVSGVVHTARAVCAYALYPSIYYGERADFFLRGVPDNVRRLFATDQENRRLREKIRELEIELEKSRPAAAEAERLRDEMKIAGSSKWQGTWARVSARDTKNWYGFITVSRGTKDGIKVNDTVMAAQNGKISLLGRIYETYPDFSRVMLAGNKAFSVIVSLGINGSEVLAEGTGSARMKIEYIPENLPLEEGTEIFSAPDAQLYVPNARVGVLSKIYKRDSEMSFTSADVQLYSDIDSVKEVYIVRNNLPDDLVPPTEEQQ